MNYNTPVWTTLNKLVRLWFGHKDSTASLLDALVWENLESGEAHGTGIPNTQRTFGLVYFMPPLVTGNINSIPDNIAVIKEAVVS